MRGALALGSTREELVCALVHASAYMGSPRLFSAGGAVNQPESFLCRGFRPDESTGCISQINDHLWEGRYSPVWPDGVKRPRNIYAHDRETCETLLAELIAQTKAEIAAEKARRAGERRPA